MAPVFLVPLVVFAFTLGKASKTHVDVIKIDEQGMTSEKVVQPILVVKEEGSISVRSGFELKGKYTAKPRSYYGDLSGLDAADALLREIKRNN